MKAFNSVNKYEDIINLPHHVSPTRAQMPVSDRAAQFSPFAALTGYDDAVKETARLTEEWVEPDENSKMVLDRRLQYIIERIKEQPQITVTFFQPDAKKEGGAYITMTGAVKKIDSYERCVVLNDGMRIPIARIYELSVF